MSKYLKQATSSTYSPLLASTDDTTVYDTFISEWSAEVTRVRKQIGVKTSATKVDGNGSSSSGSGSSSGNNGDETI